MNKTIRDPGQFDHLTKNDFITELYNRYGKKLYAYAIKNWGIDEDAAWDLIYKTLYKVMDSHTHYSFATEDKFASFVFKIFINYLRNHYRDHKKTTENFQIAPIDSNELQDKPSGVNENVANIKLKVLQEELDKMEDWQRMLLLMRSDGYPYAEIAGYVNKPEEQLKVYYQRLKKTITEKINERL